MVGNRSKRVGVLVSSVGLYGWEPHVEGTRRASKKERRREEAYLQNTEGDIKWLERLLFLVNASSNLWCIFGGLGWTSPGASRPHRPRPYMYNSNGKIRPGLGNIGQHPYIRLDSYFLVNSYPQTNKRLLMFSSTRAPSTL